MGFLSDREREAVEGLAGLATGNPFLAGRVEDERRALGDAFTPVARVWHEGSDRESANPNVSALGELVERLAPRLRERLAGGVAARPEELAAYHGLVCYLLYYRHIDVFQELIARGLAGESSTGPVRAWDRFRAQVHEFLELPPLRFDAPVEPALLFAWGYQIRRAFEGTFRGILGGSMPAARLRAAVWESIFTHDARRYVRSLTARMSDVTTLVLGESGTGKELVARAVGMARFLPFDPGTKCFAEDFARGFHAVNLSALSPTLIESELFGHRKGAFTGALQDRVGWLESCSALGTVFLDEIGELEGTIQVKLLRVLQDRRFQRVGETGERRFLGKLIAATHRDLPAEIGAGRFRQDLYYRLCADVIHTPTLREQIEDSPDELPGLVRVLAERIVGRQDAPALADEVLGFVRERLGPDHPWPGNVRELEQCVRNVLVRGRYEPAAFPAPGGADADDWTGALRRGELSADELLSLYCTRVYAQTGSYEEAGRRLGLDRRTVKARIDPEWLARFEAEAQLRPT